MSLDNNYSGEIEHDSKKIKILDVQGYRRLNSNYKKVFINAFIETHQEDFEIGLKELNENKTITFEEKRNIIIESFYFNSIVSVIDFIHSFPISKTIAFYFIKHNILVTNIIYSKEKNETYFNWKLIYEEIQTFNWKETNYFAIK